MNYQKPYSQIQRDKAIKRLKSHLRLVAGLLGFLAFLIILGLVGAIAR